MNLPFASYQTSRDYRKLWELAQTAQIVCIVDRYENDSTDRRIVSTRYSPAEHYQITVETCGIRWCSAANVDQFVQQCERWSLEWLVPARAALAAEPVGEGPSDEDLRWIFYYYCDRPEESMTWRERGSFQDAVRAVLARWGRSAAQPAEEEAIDSEWQPCVKLAITVHVRKQRPGETHVSTREGITPIRPDDLIMRGVAGEEYPIGRELFSKSYRLGAASPAPATPEVEG